MKINWKDLSIAFLIGLAVCLIYAIGFAQNPIGTSLLVELSFLPFMAIVSLGFYFQRNRTSWSDAVSISFLYGFSLLFLIVICVILYAVYLAGLSFVVSRIEQMNLTGIFINIILIGCVNGIIAIIFGCIAKYVVELPFRSSGKKNQKLKGGDIVGKNIPA